MEEKLYIRKLYPQELGYRRGEARKAGGYIFVSKECASYFPALSETIKNDHVVLMVMPPRSNDAVLTNYVYHNDKITEGKSGGRDEFRLYLNSGNNPDGILQPDDIVIIQKRLDPDGLPVYRILHFPIGDSTPEYVQLDRFVQEGNHALVSANQLRFISTLANPMEIERKVVPSEVVKEVLEEDEEATIRPVPLDAGVMSAEFQYTNLIREGSFRDLLLFFYDFKCAITDSVIRYEELINLEAAHIIPDHLGGPRHPRNGLPLSRDLHWAFDSGFFSINDDYTILVHEKVRDLPSLSELHEKKLRLPDDKRAWPSQPSIQWHRENVFGLFEQKVV